MCGHCNIFLISQFFYISYFGILTSKCGLQFFFHCNLTSQLVQNFLLHTNSFLLDHLLHFYFLPSFLPGTSSHVLIASVSLNHKPNVLLIHFSFHSPSSEMRGTCVFVACRNYFSAFTYVQTKHQPFPHIPARSFFSSYGLKCPKLREVQLLICVLGTTVQFLP